MLPTQTRTTTGGHGGDDRKTSVAAQLPDLERIPPPISVDTALDVLAVQQSRWRRESTPEGWMNKDHDGIVSPPTFS